MTAPFDLDDLAQAAAVVGRHVPPTAQYKWPMLRDAAGSTVIVKHENHTPIGAFKVRGGLVGRVSGFLYHYAGRIDPNRSSRGGKLARVIRASSTLVFRMLNCACVARTLKLTGGDKITVWELQGRVIGRQDSRKSENFLAWPWSVFVELPKKAI